MEAATPALSPPQANKTGPGHSLNLWIAISRLLLDWPQAYESEEKGGPEILTRVSVLP